jgi:D-alanyl-D-alanine carboxypeptidase
MSARPPSRPPLPLCLWLLPLLCLLAACGGNPRLARTDAYAPGSATYPEPGPPEDPWRPYIRDASSRFTVPQQWIRAVMKQESGGHEYLDGQPIVSGAGAMGLMQLMPATYADLQSQYGLGSDPFEPHDNILAGTAYISQMYQKYGAPGFLAAYNAGPQRLDDYINRGRALPNETVNYVAAIAPNLGTEIAMSGPLAAYASGGTPDAYQAPVRLASYRVPVRRGGGACWHDPDAAFDPGAPCQARPVLAPAVLQAPVEVASAAPAAPPGCARDPESAYDSPCRPASIAVPPAPARSAIAPVYAQASAPAYAPAYAPVFSPAYAPPSAYAPLRRTRAAVTLASASVTPRVGGWGIQVGAYSSVEQARFATTMARQADFARLAGSQSVVQPTSPFGRTTLYRARLAGLARGDAGQACAALTARNIPCMVVQPGG